ncbi:unnamed protein product [Musa acuminata subsp. burmannicoides]
MLTIVGHRSHQRLPAAASLFQISELKYKSTDLGSIAFQLYTPLAPPAPPSIKTPAEEGGCAAMVRKRSPIVRKALDLIALGFSTRVAKVRRPIARKLLLLKRTKRFNLLRHYNYSFIAEYEFSPSNSQLFRRPCAPPKKRSRFLSLLCGGDGAESVAEGGVFQDELEMLSPGGAFRDELLYDDDGIGRELSREFSEYGDEEDGTVDQRAERFIEKFYEEMRNQRRESDAAREHAI